MEGISPTANILSFKSQLQTATASASRRSWLQTSPLPASLLANSLTFLIRNGFTDLAIRSTSLLIALNLTPLACNVARQLAAAGNISMAARLSIAAAISGQPDIVHTIALELLQEGDIHTSALVTAALWKEGVDRRRLSQEVMAHIMVPVAMKAVAGGAELTHKMALVQQQLYDTGNVSLLMWLVSELIEVEGRLDVVVALSIEAITAVANGEQTIIDTSAMLIQENKLDAAASAVIGLSKEMEKKGNGQNKVLDVMAGSSLIVIHQGGNHGCQQVATLCQKLLAAGQQTLVGDVVTKLVNAGHAEQLSRVGLVSSTTTGQKSMVPELTGVLLSQGKYEEVKEVGKKGMKAMINKVADKLVLKE